MKRLLCLFIGGIFAVGCAPAVVLEKPAEWPQEYLNRRLYNTPHAFIYASSEEAAGEADRLVIAVEKDFEQAAGRKAGKGLVFVTDANDGPLVPKLKELIDLEVRRKSAEVRARQGTKDKNSSEDPLEKWNEVQKKVEEFGLSMDVAIKAMPIPVPSEAASLILGLPRYMTDRSQWIVAVPTKALIRGLVQKMIVTGIEKKDFGPLGKAMAGLLLGIVNIERTVTDAFAMTRDIVLFSQWVNQQPDWGAEEKSRRIKAYFERKKAQTLGGLIASSVKQADKGGDEKQTPQETKQQETKP